ncbi:DUF4198 domain-containing protein [Belnapia sp. F-4-1]|uniref:DUF4198 domain-containing protein n=1 Tax=Belnapia sp. F-4-1 TaxID=1545443 RepID=UPI0005B897CA|nr:DUF4198 domain-containing protein [Belnapia sp. F-4-1]
MIKTRIMMLVATLLAAPLPVAAHQVWLEREGDTVRAYFGEPVEDTRERSGGLLDRIASPRIFTDDLSKPLPLRREADHVQASLPPGSGDVRLVEDGLAPYGRTPEQRTRPIMLAREGRAEVRGVMELELVPVAPGANSFTLLLRGQPLPRAEVTVVAPPRWERRLHTNAEGRVTIATPWAGRYVMEAVHTEDRAGGAGEAAYAKQRLVSTVSFSVAEGLAWAERR